MRFPDVTSFSDPESFTNDAIDLEKSGQVLTSRTVGGEGKNGMWSKARGAGRITENILMFLHQNRWRSVEGRTLQQWGACASGSLRLIDCARQVISLVDPLKKHTAIKGSWIPTSSH